ncbi:unnamed protein product [Lactuca saligna]|uniref:Glutaredoxin domain-containing protein n=1 Tax=Lactuca saligna TaxID=75948 RepID=A0AA35V5N9_LACSI|nr:unnamed protein product [Lactuca saligna]
MATVTALVNERSVVIFSKTSCCMCHTIQTLISSFGANPTVYELDKHPKGQQLEKELKGLGCKPSVPAVFIGQQLIGGANEIMTLHLKGQLVPLLLRTTFIPPQMLTGERPRKITKHRSCPLALLGSGPHA